MPGKPFTDRTPLTVTFTTDKGALAALKDNPLMLSEDVLGAYFANAVRRGVRHLHDATEAPEPDVTVELKSVRVSDEEADEEAWSVVMSGTWGDCTVCTSVSREFASAQASFLAECLKIVLKDEHVTLELPS